MKFFQNQLWVEGWCMFNESHSVNWRTREYNHAAPLESTLVMHWDTVGKLSLNLMPWSNSDVYSLTESCVQESESAQPSFPGSGVSHKMSVWAVVHWRPWPSQGAVCSVTHPLAVGRRSQFLATWLSLEGCPRILLWWLASPKGSDPREKAQWEPYVFVTLEIMHCHFFNVPLVTQMSST